MAATRITEVSVETAQVLGRTRISEVSVTASAAPAPTAVTRITEVQVIAGGYDGGASTRITEVSVTTTGVEAVGYTRVTEVSVTAGPIFQDGAILPCIFYCDTDGSFRPYLVLTVDDYPWS